MGGRRRKRVGRLTNWSVFSLNTRLWYDQRGLCCYCEKPMHRPGTDPEHTKYPTREHLQRKAEEGGNEFGNLRLAHRGCNLHRGERNWLEWKTICMGETTA